MSTAVTLDDVRRVVSDAVTGGLGTIGGLKIDKYDGSISWDAIEWLEEYIDLSNVKNWTDSNRFKNFGHFLTRDAKNWYRLYVTKAIHPPTDWDELKEAFLAYHVPKDKDNYLREQMIARKQKSDEDVVKYITHKHLLCVEMNPSMPFKEMLSYIVEGMNPQVKATIMHKNNPNIDKLQENARNIEEGLKKSGKLESTSIDEYKIRVLNNEENVRILTEKMDKLFDKLNENSDHLHDYRREARMPYRERQYDRFGRRIVDRNHRDSRERYANILRDSSRESLRNRSRDSSRENNYRRFNQNGPRFESNATSYDTKGSKSLSSNET